MLGLYHTCLPVALCTGVSDYFYPENTIVSNENELDKPVLDWNRERIRQDAQPQQFRKDNKAAARAEQERVEAEAKDKSEPYPLQKENTDTQ